jgi:hypothetical protein
VGISQSGGGGGGRHLECLLKLRIINCIPFLPRHNRDIQFDVQLHAIFVPQ